jgi:chorismate synthase
MRFLTAGDSHGEALLGILEGFPSHVPVDEKAINGDLARRQFGHGRSERMKVEQDRVRVLGGVWNGRTSGAPLGLLIENKAGHGVGASQTRLGSVPRPGHADLAGSMKYGFADVEPVSERASARETAMRVAVGAVCRRMLAELSMEVCSHVTGIGTVSAPARGRLSARQKQRVENSPVRCADARAEKSMLRLIDAARRDGDSLGGAVEVLALGVPPGLGSHARYDSRLDARIASAVMSIPSVKGLEIGNAIDASRLPGSRVHDEIFFLPGRGAARRTNNAGGIEGGMSNGETIVVRAFVKPVPTIVRPLRSYDMRTLRAASSPRVRADACVVPSVGVIAEAMLAFEIARALCEKFGGDSLSEIARGLKSYLAGVGARRGKARR